MKTQAIAVLDVGKSNKKVVLFDRDLQVLSIRKAGFEEVEQDGLLVEQSEAVFQWFLDMLSEAGQTFDIRAISVATHGATVACLDESGTLALPVLCYTNETDEGFSDRFYAQCGPREELHRRTLTPQVGELANAARLLAFMQERFGEAFDRTKHILFYPQWFVYRLTGNICAEPTMLGCHTYLFDPQRGGYSSVADRLNVSRMLPEQIGRSWEPAGVVQPDVARQAGLPEDCIVTRGVHDSNASLLPYEMSSTERFVLNSTGTWCVAMRAGESVQLREEQIGKTVFYNFDVFANPVKTSIFMGGREFQTYVDLLQKIHSRSDLPQYDADMYEGILSAGCEFILPAITQSTGIFPDHPAAVVDGAGTIPFTDISAGQVTPALFENYERAIAAVNISLAIQSAKAIEHVDYQPGDTVYVEGGFAANVPYLKMLGCVLGAESVTTSSMPEATATGAAVLGLAALEGVAPDRLETRPLVDSTQTHTAAKLRDQAYVATFLDLCRQSAADA